MLRISFSTACLAFSAFEMTRFVVVVESLLAALLWLSRCLDDPCRSKRIDSLSLTVKDVNSFSSSSGVRMGAERDNDMAVGFFVVSAVFSSLRYVSLDSS